MGILVAREADPVEAAPGGNVSGIAGHVLRPLTKASYTAYMSMNTDRCEDPVHAHLWCRDCLRMCPDPGTECEGD